MRKSAQFPFFVGLTYLLTVRQSFYLKIIVFHVVICCYYCGCQHMRHKSFNFTTQLCAGLFLYACEHFTLILNEFVLLVLLFCIAYKHNVLLRYFIFFSNVTPHKITFGFLLIRFDYLLAIWKLYYRDKHRCMSIVLKYFHISYEN